MTWFLYISQKHVSHRNTYSSHYFQQTLIYTSDFFNWVDKLWLFLVFVLTDIISLVDLISPFHQNSLIQYTTRDLKFKSFGWFCCHNQNLHFVEDHFHADPLEFRNIPNIFAFLFFPPLPQHRKYYNQTPIQKTYEHQQDYYPTYKQHIAGVRNLGTYIMQNG